MLTPRTETPWGQSYGYGWFVGEECGRRVAYHPGTTGGVASVLKRFPDEEVLIVALFTQDLIIAEELFGRLAAIALEEPWRPLLEPASAEIQRGRLGHCLGEYAMEGGDRVFVTWEDNRVVYREGDGPGFPVHALKEGRGFVKELNARLDFREPDGGGPMKLVGQFDIYRWTGERLQSPLEP
jgi:hypothetical protein